MTGREVVTNYVERINQLPKLQGVEFVPCEIMESPDASKPEVRVLRGDLNLYVQTGTSNDWCFDRIADDIFAAGIAQAYFTHPFKQGK